MVELKILGGFQTLAVFICFHQFTQGQDVIINQFSYELSGAKLFRTKDITVHFEVTIENVGAVDIHDITYPGTNFAANIMLSDAALELAPENPNILSFDATFGEDDKLLRKSLDAGDTVSLTGKAVVNVPAANCEEVSHVCIQIKPGPGASYTESSTLNNYKCEDIQSRMACIDDAVDLSIRYIDVVHPTLAMGSFVSVDLLMQVELYGSATLKPSEGDEYSIRAYLSIDKELNNVSDTELIDLPKEFDSVKTKSFTTGGYLDVSGAGIVLPDDHDFCGPVYLIIHIDGKNGVPGQIDEPNEENNIAAVRVVLLCKGDRFGLRDFSYTLSTNQNEIFEEANTPVWVSATVFNTDPNREPFQPGPANFKLTLWLSNTKDIAGALEVTQPGVTYKSVQQSPQAGVIMGDSVTIKDALIWIDGKKFSAGTKMDKNYIILKVESPDGSSWMDSVQINNYEARPIAVSIHPKTGQMDFDLDPNIQITQSVTKGKFIVADGTFKPVTKVSSTKTPMDGNTFSFVLQDERNSYVGHMTYPAGFNLGNVFTKLYWSVDGVFDPETDELSNIILTQTPYRGKGYIQASGTDFLQPPNNRNLCGVVYGILHVDVPENQRESLEHNNVVADMVMIQCNATDELGLTTASYYRDVSYIWENTASRLYLSVDVSCIDINCNKTGSSESFQLKLYLVTGAKDEEVELLSITSNADIDDVTNGGLNAVFQEGSLRQQITFSADVVVSTEHCLDKYKLLGIRLHPEDSYPDNDVIYLDLPELICGETDEIDLEPSEFSIDVSELKVGQRVPFSLMVDLSILGTSSLVDNGWPAFQFQLFLYDVASGVSMKIPYKLTDCQYETLMEHYTTTSSITLDDHRGFIIPEVGFETFCGSHSLKVFVTIDTYDLDPTDDIIGEVFETLETNNVKYTTDTFTLDKSQMDCSKYLNLDIPRLGTEVMAFEGPDYIWGNHETTFTIQLAVINIHTAPIWGGSEMFKDYTIQAYLSGDSKKTNDDQHFKVTISNTERQQQYKGMEAGGVNVFNIQATLCQASSVDGCIEENVLDDEAECPTVQNQEPQILFGVGEIRLALEGIGYQPQFNSHMVQVKCTKSVTPMIEAVAYSGIIYAEHTYVIPFQMDVINYSPHNPSNIFSGDEPKFHIHLYLSNNNDTSAVSDENTLQLQVENTVASIPQLDTEIDPGKAVMVSSTAQLHIGLAKCDPLESVDLYVKAVIEIPNGGTFHNNGYAGGADVMVVGDFNVNCSEDHIDLNVVLFSLNKTEITLGIPVGFALEVQISTSGSASFSGDKAKYDVKFFLSFDEELDPEDAELHVSFGVDQQSNLKSNVATDQQVTHTLSSVDTSDSLNISATQGGSYCFQRDVFVIVQVTILDGSTEPDPLNNTAYTSVSVYCNRDLFLLESASIHPIELTENSNLEMSLDVTIANSHPGLIDIPQSINMEDLFYFQLYTDAGTFIPLTSVVISESDRVKLKSALPVNESVTLSGIRLVASINSAVCTEIESTGSFTVRVRHGLGLADGLVDGLSENDVIAFKNATCSQDTADLQLESLSITGSLAPSVEAFGSYPYELVFVLSFGGSMTFSSGPDKHFDYKIWISHDMELSLSLDKELLVDTDGVSELKNGYQQAEETVTITKNGNAGIIFPEDVQENYCGRSFLIVLLDTDNNITETSESNNDGSVQVFLDCDNDVYDLEDVEISSQDIYYPDLPSAFQASFRVYNVQRSQSRILKNTESDNYRVVLYAQIGPVFNSRSAIEITDSWTIASDESDQFGGNLNHHGYHSYTMATTELTLTQAMCDEGVDHLILVVESNKQEECLVYNNFHAHPVSCEGYNAVDINVALDRNGQPVFELTGDDVITLGEPKPFALKTLISVRGNGGWTSRGVGEGPVFKYQFVLSDGSDRLVIPHEIDIEKINAATTVSKVIDLGGTLELTLSNALLMCKPDLELTVYLDVEDDVAEYNELNNHQIITTVKVTDGESGMCDSALDLEADSFQLEPQVTLAVEMGYTFDYSFSFSVHAGQNAPTLASISFSLYITDDVRKDDKYVEIEGSTKTHQTTSGRDVTVTGVILPYSQLTLHQFCQGRPYLGVNVTTNGDINDVEMSNNVAFTQVMLTCPQIYAVGVLDLTLSPSSELLDSKESTIIFTISLINKGRTVAASAENMFKLNISLSANNDPVIVFRESALVATFEGLDSPDRMSEFENGDIWEYTNATAKLTMSTSDCVGKQYLCLAMVITNGISDDPADNIQCVDVFSGPVILDCARDIAVDSLSYTYSTSEVFQNVAVVFTFSIVLNFTGPKVPAGTSPHLVFAVYLSDGENITSSLNNGTTLRVDTESVTDGSVKQVEELKGEINDGDTLSIELMTDVTIPAVYCLPQDRYVCVEYVWLASFTPPFRDLNPDNNFMCVTVADDLGCHDNTKDLKPVWLGFENGNLITLNESVNFDLQVKVDIRGTGTEGVLSFEGAFYVSDKSELDDTAVEIAYDGFSYGHAAEEMQRHLTVGEHVLNMGGVSIKISVDTSLHHHLCGAVFVLFEVDPNNNVSEAYETNNVIAAPAIIQCQGDILRLEVTNFAMPDGFWPNSRYSLVQFDAIVQNIGPNFPLASSGSKNYVFELYASDSDTWGVGHQTSISVGVKSDIIDRSFIDGQMSAAMLTGESHWLPRLKMHTMSELLDQSVCESVTHMFVCVSHITYPETAKFSNNCHTQKVKPEDLHCEPKAAIRDLWLSSMLVPHIISVPASISVQYDIGITVGSLPVDAGDFISALYLSADDIWNPEKAHKVTDLINSVGNPADSSFLHKVTNTDVAIPVLADLSLCGEVYLHILVDSEDEITESSETNNVGHMPVTLLCDSDYFSLSDVHLVIPDGHLFENTPVLFTMQATVTCLKVNCNVPMASTDNIVLHMTSNQGDSTSHDFSDVTSDWWIGETGNVHVPPRYWNSLSVDLVGGLNDENTATDNLMHMHSFWEESEYGITMQGQDETEKPFASGYPAPGFSRKFLIHGSMRLPEGKCSGSGLNNLTVTVDFGPALKGNTDGLLENNELMLQVRCHKGKMPDLIASPIEFWPHDPSCLDCLPVLPTMSMVEAVLYNIPGSRSDLGMTSPGVSETGTRKHSPLTEFLANDAKDASPEPLRYSFSLAIQVTGESIPANDAMPIAAPFTIGLFLSHDSVWSRDDINLKYNLSHSIAGDLRRGIVVGETIVLQEFVQGVTLPPNVCGYWHVIVHIDDTNRIKEASEANNFAATRIFIDCEKDIFEMTYMTLNVEPSDTFWQGTVFTLSVDLALQYNTEFSHASLPAVEVQAYLSSDTQWDPSSDVLLDSKIQEKVSGMLHKGDTIILKDLALNGSITTDNCTQKHYYLIILALPFGHQAHVESVLQNNWKAVPLNVKCGAEIDLKVSSVSTGGQTILTPGQRVTQLNVEIGKQDPDGVIGDGALFASLWLSKDHLIDPKFDVSIQYTVGSTEFVLPEALHPSFCGRVFLLAHVDPSNQVAEVNEENNVGIGEIIVKCNDDVLSVHSLDISQPSHLLDLSISTPLSLEVQVECTQVPSLCPTAPADPNQVHFTFQIKVYDRSGFEIGELTPGKINTTWISAAADNDIDSTLFLPEDGLRKSFTSRTEWTYTIQSNFSLADMDVCEEVMFIGIEMVKGDSDELSNYPDWLDKDKVAKEPVSVRCPRSSVDLDVTEFTLASMVLNMALGFLEVTDLEVTISSSNMPSRSSDKPLFDFSYVVVGGDSVIGPSMVDLHVEHAETVVKQLKRDWTSGQFSLREQKVNFNVALLTHLCGQQAQLKVVLDAGNEIIETDETNNDLAWNVSVSGCQDGIDQKIRDATVPPMLSSGETFTLSVIVDTVLVGAVSFTAPNDPSEERYNLQLSLVDSLDYPKKVIPISVDTSHLSELKENLTPSSAESTQAGIATVHRHYLGDIAVTIPADLILCDQSWFFQVEVMLYAGIAKLELNNEDNKLIRHLRIACPRDQLALLAVEVVSLPSAWWSESTNMVQMYTHIINTGSDIINSSATTFSIKQYFSLDNELDAADTEFSLVDTEGQLYEYQGAIWKGQVISSGLLMGELKIDSKELCEAAKGDSSVPTLFWKLFTSYPSWSVDKGNDVMKKMIDKSTLHCTTENLDLDAHELVLPGSGNDLESLNNIQFSFHYKIKKTATASISSSNFQTTEVSIKVEFFLSNDDYFGLDDVAVNLTYTQDQLDILQQGIPVNSLAGNATFEGNNLHLSPANNPYYAFYCGKSFLLVKITNLRDQNLDSVPENNVLATSVTLKCPGDVLSFESLSMTLVPPQKYFYHSTTSKFILSATVKSYSTEVVANGTDNKPVFTIRAFMSEDAILDVVRDPELVLEYDNILADQFQLGFDSLEEKHYKGVVEVFMSEVVCAYNPKYLIVLIQKYSHFNIEEPLIANNYQYISLRNILRCTKKNGDFMIKKFAVTNGEKFKPDDEINFDFEIETILYGASNLAVKGVFDAEVDFMMLLDFQFFLSHDEAFDSSDYSVGYDLLSNPKMKELYDRKSIISAAKSIFKSGHLLILPKASPASYCGRAYLLAVLDPFNLSEEVSEYNNHWAVPIYIHCHQDVLGVPFSLPQPQALYQEGPGHFQIFLSVYSEPTQEETGTTDLQFKFYVQSSRNPAAILHDITPTEVTATIVQPIDFPEAMKSTTDLNITLVDTYLDISKACEAGRDPIESGPVRLLLEVRAGSNTEISEQVDSVPLNNQVWTEIQVMCGESKIDLSVKDMEVNSRKFGPLTDSLEFGWNPFKLVVSAKVSDGGGWSLTPSAPESPPMFNVRFHYSISVDWQDDSFSYSAELPYDMQNFKDIVNNETTANRDIDLSDLANGWVLETSDHLILCLLDPDSFISVYVYVDDADQVLEVNEGNNLEKILLKPPSNNSCTAGSDFSVDTWEVLNTHYDIVRTGEYHAFELRILLILVEDVLNSLSGTENKHFDVEIVLSHDQLLDKEDVALDIEWDENQTNGFQMSASNLDMMDLSGESLYIPMTDLTYQFCWRTIYLLVNIDPGNQTEEVNKDNNVGAYQVVLDCGMGADECIAGFHDCHENATCIDLEYHLYSIATQGYLCKCLPGFTGNGTFCENINECEEPVSNASVLRNCQDVDHSECSDLIGSFECQCLTGYIKSDDGSNDTQCLNVNECIEGTHRCDANANCTDNFGSYNCTCNSGFEGDGYNCTNKDDCQPDTCLNGGTCRDVVNTVECDCPALYGGDRCELVHGNWGPWGQWGPCLADCGPGYRERTRSCDNPKPANGGRKCIVENSLGSVNEEECEETECESSFDWCLDDPCHREGGGRCEMANKGTSFFCTCQQGFQIVRNDQEEFLRCDDIDECFEDKHDCSPMATCINTLGSYNCSCKVGFHGDGKICEDVNECEEVLADCDENAACVNTPGGYNCVCTEGYKEEKFGDTVTRKCIEKRLFAYGFDVGDTLVETVSNITGERMSPPIPVPHGLPLDGGTVLRALYISENGIIVGTRDPVMHMNRPTYNQPRDFSEMTLNLSMNNLAIIAPFFADVETETSVSQIWYQSYTDTSDKVFTKVQTMLNHTVEVTQPMRFLLKVTWYKMKPHYQAEDGEFNTFQAVVATDYAQTYFLFLYDAGGMTWKPVYSAEDIQITYKGYPAWIGWLSVSPNGIMNRPPQDPNSGAWSTDVKEPNAYRMDNRTSQSHNLTGVVVFTAASNPATFNPRAACFDWYQSESAPSEWGAELVGNCPSTETQASHDPRFETDTGDRCYTWKFSLDSGSNLRCCYKDGTGYLLTALNTNNGLTVNSYTEIGFIHRHKKNMSSSSRYSRLDVQPFEWCCLDSKAYSTDYCDLYLQKRLISSCQHYDRLALGIVYGDPHFVTLDGLSYTFNGFGEYILLRTDQTTPLYAMIQARTDTIDTPSQFDEPKATKLSAVAIQVGNVNSPVIQVYLKDTEEREQVEVYVGDKQVTASSIPDLSGIDIDMEDSARPASASVLYKEGIWIHVEARKVEDQKLLKATVAIPTSFHGNQCQGLLGSFDGDLENELVTSLGTKLVDKASEATSDDIMVWAKSWSLRMVYGQSQNGANAKDRSLFTQYPESYPDAISYYSLNYNPLVFTEEDFTQTEKVICADGTSWSSECIHDYKVTNNSAFAATTLKDKQDFMLNQSMLDNMAPQFIPSDPHALHLKLNEQMWLTIKVSDDKEVTLKASIKDSKSEEKLDNTELAVTQESRGLYTSTLEWKPVLKDVYTIEIEAMDSQSFTSIYKPPVILCACENDATCDFSNPWGWVDTFAYASCICPPGRSGNFCSDDLDACSYMPCFTEQCTDLTPEKASLMSKQFECEDCMEGTEGDGMSCSDINECVQAEGSPHRHKCQQICVNTPGSYICSCGPGFQLSTDGLSCDDIKECFSSTLNSCDFVLGYCVDVPGSYTCTCNDGYLLDPETNKCVDKDECAKSNGGCDLMCFNTIGSFFCDCGPGYMLYNGTQCSDTNECELNAECDQKCINHAGYYECGCRQGFTLDTDGKRCLPDNPCNTLKCDPRAICGIDDITGVEKCFCGHGYNNLPGHRSVCIDVDECSQNKSNCDMNADCTNTQGGYTCQCKAGFKPSLTNSKRCYDIDECLDGTLCEQLCVNYPGNYSCQCASGYLLNDDLITCTDINECELGQQNACSPLADCINLKGSYSCQCRTGFEGSGFTCHDVDECLTGVVPCQGKCDNTYGSYRCSCVKGYKVDPANPHSCIDLNECFSPGLTCDHSCINTQGSFTCSCKEGFSLVGKTMCQADEPCEEACGGGLCYHDNNNVEKCMCVNGYKQKNIYPLDECIDINECESGEDRCITRRHAHCVNKLGIEGNYECVCDDGYTLDTDLISCSDEDECLSHKDECDPVSTTCVNMPGTYTCQCKTGFYSHNATHCQDEDECRSPRLNACRKRLGVGVCVNTPGAYTCHCEAGYQGNGTQCRDIDECRDPRANNCDISSQVCINSAGSYHCECKSGFQRDLSSGTCKDIDECSSPVLNECLDKAGCINKIGSYHCTCYDGVVLSDDGKTCTALTPCENPSACPCSDTSDNCQQLCIQINDNDNCICRYPYQMINGVCQDVNECQPPDDGISPCNTSHSTCVDRPGLKQFECQCDESYIPDLDGLGCTETNGLWTGWSDWTSCSKPCSGYMSRSRTCSDPEPYGYGRTCEGDSINKEVCNMYCESIEEEVAVSRMLTFHLLPVIKWFKVERTFLKAIAWEINQLCRRNAANYSLCCGQDISQGDIPSRGDIITADNLHITTAYPQPIGRTGSLVAVYAIVQHDNQLCPHGSNRERRDVSEHDGTLSRSRRALEPVGNTTYSILDHSILEAVLNDSETWITIQQYLDTEGLLETYGPLLQYSVSDAVTITTTVSPTEEALDDTALTLWMILAIVAGCIAALIIIVVLIVLLRKRQKSADLEGEDESRPVSVVSRKNFDNDAESIDSISLSGSYLSGSSFTGSQSSLKDMDVFTPTPNYTGPMGNNRAGNRNRENSGYSSNLDAGSRLSYQEDIRQGYNQGYKDIDGQDSRRDFIEEPDDQSTPEPESRPVTQNTQRSEIESRPQSTLPGAALVAEDADDQSESEDEKPKKRKDKKGENNKSRKIKRKK